MPFYEGFEKAVHEPPINAVLVRKVISCKSISRNVCRKILAQHLILRMLKTVYRYKDRSYKSSGGNDSFPRVNSVVNSDSGRFGCVSSEHWMPSLRATYPDM